MKHLVNIDLNKNELQNARIQNLGTAPTSPVSGQIYYNTGDNTEYFWNGSAWIPTDAQKRTGIPIANLATNPLDRANHTGTQLAATISDFDTQVRTNRLDQMAVPTTGVAMGGQKITGMAAPTAGTDGANKQYVDDAVAAISWKDEVKVCSTAAGTLASSFANGSVVDGVTLATGDRILLKDQAAGAENGIYVVNASGAPTRSTDGDTAAKIKGAAVYVTNGTVNAGKRLVCNVPGDITLGTTALSFVQFDGGTAYTAGNGLTLSGSDFNVGAGTGITVAADTVAIDTAVVVRKFTQLIGDGTSTSIAVTHNLNNQHSIASVRDASTNAEVICNITYTSANVATFGFAVAPTASALRVVVLG